MDNKSYTVRVPKRWARIALIVGATALTLAPLTAVATHSFTDVPDTHTFHDDIEWLKDADVTRGCNPPANTLFCPEDNVKRGQMAAFMKRFAQYLGAEDGTPAQADHATTADSATTAGDADTVGGLSPAELGPRAAFNSTENAPDGANYNLPVEITAPAPGVLLSNAGIEAFEGPDSFYRCRILVDGQYVPGSERDSELNATDNSEENCSTGGGIAVDTGTYQVSLDVIGVNAGVDFNAAQVWALWVPFDGTGAVPTAITSLGDPNDSAEEKPVDE